MEQLTKEAIKAKLLLSEELTYSTTAEYETDHYSNYAAMGDEGANLAFIEGVEDNLEYDEVWGWCCVKQTAEYFGVKGEDYLGACSYRGVIDFKDKSGYYEDMKDNALNDLVDQLYTLKTIYPELPGL